MSFFKNCIYGNGKIGMKNWQHCRMPPLISWLIHLVLFRLIKMLNANYDQPRNKNQAMLDRSQSICLRLGCSITNPWLPGSKALSTSKEGSVFHPNEVDHKLPGRSGLTLLLHIISKSTVKNKLRICACCSFKIKIKTRFK